MSSSSSVHIESLLREFYQISTTNARKRQIESELMAYKSQPGAWQLCLCCVANTACDSNNQFLWFFCSSTLEYTISRRWSQLSAADRSILRETLWNSYANLVNDDGSTQRNQQAPPRRQRDTLAQLIATMGKREFPDEHPEYIMHCMTLLKTKFQLGINLLRITSEEVVSNREDVPTERKNYFQSCVSHCMPDVMELLTKYLIIAVCYVNEDINSVFNGLVDYNLVSSLPNDNQLSSSILDLLTCVQHLVSWSSTDLISEYFLMSILNLAQYRTASDNLKTTSITAQQQHEISIAGLQVLNEMLYLQKQLPYALTLMSGVNGLLERLNASKHHSEVYTDKFRELLRLYVVKYWPKLLYENEILETFLKSLYCCTITRNGALDFTEKLEIWTPIIKGLTTNGKMLSFNEIVHQLISEIMYRIQFEYNKVELELLDDELLENDNTQTELQQYISQCIECIALVAESRSNDVFAQVYCHWVRPYEYLLSCEHDIDCGNMNEFANKVKNPNFGEQLHDFSTVCQAIVRITSLIDVSSGMNGSSNASMGSTTDIKYQVQVIAENLLTILKFLTSNKLIRLIIPDVDVKVIQMEFDNLFAQVLMAIRSILPLSASLRSDESLHIILTAIGGALMHNLQSTQTPLVEVAASELLLCISTVIRPKSLLESPAILNLMQASPRLTAQQQQQQQQITPSFRQVVANIYTSLISYLVLPWKNVANNEQQQDYQRRCAVLREYINCLTQGIMEIDILSETKISPITLNQLEIFSFVIKFFKDTNSTSKEMLANVFKPTINKALMIYNNFGSCNNAVANTIADFSLSILGTIPNQLGSQFIKEMITLFITVTSKEQMDKGNLNVLEKILRMFQLIVEQPGSTSFTMLPAILDFSLEHILPLAQQDNNITENCDIALVLYNLFDSILINKWQYFYKSNIAQQYQQQQHHQQLNDGTRTTITPTPTTTAAATTIDNNLHPQHFTAIFHAYGNVLVSGTDPNIVRTILASMQNVHERWNLYDRQLFRDNLLTSFQSTLINLLLAGEGALHYELLAQTLFAMGKVDMAKLYECFVNNAKNSRLINSDNCKIINEICLAADLPTFSQKLSQWIQNAHCAQLTQQQQQQQQQ